MQWILIVFGESDGARGGLLARGDLEVYFAVWEKWWNRCCENFPQSWLVLSQLQTGFPLREIKVNRSELHRKRSASDFSFSSMRSGEDRDHRPHRYQKQRLQQHCVISLVSGSHSEFEEMIVLL